MVLNEKARVYMPGGGSSKEALRRTTHLGIVAHPDDLEILAFYGIAECYYDKNKAFFGVVVTDGRGSARAGRYAGHTDAEMVECRQQEQKTAAHIGRYSGVALLNYSSSDVKRDNPTVVNDLKTIFEVIQRPYVVYTHALTDIHDTHVGVALRTIEALRQVPQSKQPQRVLGCEVWGSLDWLPDDKKVRLDVGGYDNLAASLIGVFDSQINGGKRYDLATMGRRMANATYNESHAVDKSTALIFVMDLTPLITDPTLDVANFSNELIEEFRRATQKRFTALR